MTNNLYLLFNYNNYFNRKVKRESTLAAYKAAVSNDYLVFEDVVNFNPADGISTSQIFSFDAPYAGRTADYMLVVNDSGAIISRWFVIDTERTRSGQFKYQIYRDTVADAWDSIQDAPIFVEKAILPSTDPMIFNSESMTFNQIKTNEILLKDFTDVPWIVGYVSQDPLTTTDYSFDADLISTPYTTKAEYSYNQYVNADFNYSYAADLYEVSVEKLATARDDKVAFNHSFSRYTQNNGWNSGAPYIADESKGEQFAANCKNNCGLLDEAMASTLGIQSAANKIEFDKQQDRILYITSEHKYYKVNIKTAYTAITEVQPETSSDMWNAMTNVISTSNNGFLSDTVANIGSFRYTCTKKTKRIEYQEVIPSTIDYRLSNNRHKLNDQPYCMFAMPYGYCKIVGFDGPTEQHWENITMKVAQNISATLGGESPALYDLQLLPYFPIPELRNNAGNISINGLTQDVDYSYITQDNSKVGIIFWATKSSHTFDIIHPITVSDYKIDNETKTYRLCSPNYSGSFDFSAAKNGGVTKFNIDFTYKPYNPYIHVNPNFGRLYGSDFDDARGLVCGGKFDLPQTTDAWETYERTNSNYNNIFNRQIESLELQNSIQGKMDVASIIAGTVQGAGTGAALGATVGGLGAVIGGFAGAGASLGAGIADVNLSKELRQENIDLTKDLYGYNLATIKALPNSLTSTGAFTNNNKVFPFIEVYECTQEETDALRNKIKYNGMAVGRVDKISTFVGRNWEGTNYFKGKLIQCDLADEDWHYINVLKSEINMGLFLEEVNT